MFSFCPDSSGKKLKDSNGKWREAACKTARLFVSSDNLLFTTINCMQTNQPIDPKPETTSIKNK